MRAKSALLSPQGAPAALAEAIQEIARNREFGDLIARNGRLAYEEMASEALITDRLSEILKDFA